MTLTLTEAWEATERARKMCERAEHERAVLVTPCIPHVVEVSRAWWPR